MVSIVVAVIAVVGFCCYYHLAQNEDILVIYCKNIFINHELEGEGPKWVRNLTRNW